MKIYELLGLEPLEKFRIKDNDTPESIFCFNSDDELCYYIETYHINWGRKPTITLHPCEKSKVLDLIHNPDLISKIEDEKEAPREINLNWHDSIILSGVETQYNSVVKSVKKIKNRPGFMVSFKIGEKWRLSCFDINFLELNFLEDVIKDYNMIEFEIRKDGSGDFVAKQVLD